MVYIIGGSSNGDRNPGDRVSLRARIGLSCYPIYKWVNYPQLSCPQFKWDDPPGIMGYIWIIQWIESMSMAIFYSYVPLPEGIGSQIIKWRFPNQIGGTPTAGWLTVENPDRKFR